MQKFIFFLRKIRSQLMLFLRPKSHYFLFAVKTRSLEPISSRYGFDRGVPIDRFYIETFLEQYKKDVKGVCLEITDDTYTRRFGEERVSQHDILDINEKNKRANIHADLRNLRNVKDNTYDCVIATHTFGVIDEYQTAIQECRRILKPGGVLLATVASLGVAAELNLSYWRFTTTSVKYAFGKIFGQERIEVSSYGNVLAGQAFWVGLAIEELSSEELAYNDPRYAIVIGVRAIK